jgi:hypothetical protein
MVTLADKIIDFYTDLEFTGSLPDGISLLNPFRTNPEIIPLISQFYRKFYNDNYSRYLILGINPGRNGAGITGIPFTDSRRLLEKCGLKVSGFETHETSSVFIYDMIEEFGGVLKFYSSFYISSLSPLGFTSAGKNGKEINYNYYDSKRLTDAVFDFMTGTIRQQLEFGLKRDVCFCLGTGQNFKFLSKLNDQFHFFGRIEPLEHPRYIMQYKSKQKELYIFKYIEKFSKFCK